MYNIETNGLKIINFSRRFYFPKNSLKEGLKELVIYPVEYKKRNIPNDSLWIYDRRSHEFKPEILRDDVGCGISCFIIEELNYDDNLVKDIVKAIKESNYKLGRGNHFIDFTDYHPLLSKGNLMFIHSDLKQNRKKRYPKSLEETINLTNEVINKRIDFGYKIIKRLEIRGEFYKDWTHNYIELNDDQVIYHKGVINTLDKEYEGLLALNPVEGLLFYISEWKDINGNMMHGAGRKTYNKTSLSEYVTELDNFKIIKNYKINYDKKKELKNKIIKEYNSTNEFNKHFILNYYFLGRADPYLVIREK